MINKLKLIILGLTLSLTICSCKHKTNFDSIATVKYSTDIEPIITGNCTFSGCHGDINSKKFKLLTYAALIDHCDVNAGSPETSKLYDVITALTGEKAMPVKPYNQLSEKQIQLIYIWIGQGAKNN